MKHLRYFLIISFNFVFNITNAQWVQLNTSFQTDLHCVYVVDSLTTYVGGKQGKVYKTINGGITWLDASPTQVNIAFTGLFFLNENFGWAGGQVGTIAKTTNGGSSWEISQVGGLELTNTVQSIYF